MERPSIDFEANEWKFSNCVVDKQIYMREGVSCELPFALRQTRRLTNKPRKWYMAKAAVTEPTVPRSIVLNVL